MYYKVEKSLIKVDTTVSFVVAQSYRNNYGSILDSCQEITEDYVSHFLNSRIKTF